MENKGDKSGGGGGGEGGAGGGGGEKQDDARIGLTAKYKAQRASGDRYALSIY